MDIEKLYTFRIGDDVASELKDALVCGSGGGYGSGPSEFKPTISEQIDQMKWGEIPSGDIGKVFYLEGSLGHLELTGVWVLVRKDSPSTLSESIFDGLDLLTGIDSDL